MQCPNCGEDVKENSKFCNKCGQKLESKPIQNSNGWLSNPVRIICVIIAVIVVIIVGSVAFSGLNNDDLVDVTSISMFVSYSDTPFGGAIESAEIADQEEIERLKYLKESNPDQYEFELQTSEFSDEEIENYDENSGTDHEDYQVLEVITKYSIMPKETISRVTAFSLENVIVTFENGDSEAWGSYIYEPDDMYFEDSNYDFQFTKTLENSNKTIEEYYTITNIKADIVINTTDEMNKVIGHLDADITPDHY